MKNWCDMNEWRHMQLKRPELSDLVVRLYAAGIIDKDEARKMLGIEDEEAASKEPVSV